LENQGFWEFGGGNLRQVGLVSNRFLILDFWAVKFWLEHFGKKEGTFLGVYSLNISKVKLGNSFH